jgi:hypothetical protein
MDKQIKELEEQLKILKEKRDLEILFKGTDISYMKLAEIGQSFKVPDEARLRYEQLFKEFVSVDLDNLRKAIEKQLKKKKFIIKIGWE